MLINEVLGHKLDLTEFDISPDIRLEQALDDIILRLRQGNIDEVGLADIAGEINKEIPTIDVDINDPEFKNDLIRALEENDWVKEVSEDKVFLNRDGDFEPTIEPGAEMKAKRKRTVADVSKQAMKNVKDKENAGGLEL
jgi:hypothetical protein